MAAVLEQAAQAVRQGGDIDEVLAEVRLLLPPAPAAEPVPEQRGRRATPSPPVEEPAAVMERVRTWYLALPEEVRTSWANRRIVQDSKYQAELETITGRAWDTVRTQYVAPIRKELGEPKNRQRR